MFRLWSTPVHRWLFSCVHKPTVDYCGGGGGGGGEKEETAEKPSQRQRQRQRRRRRVRVLGMTAAFAVSSAVHEAVTYVAMRKTCWPFNTFCLVFAAFLIAAWDALYPVVSEIAEAGDGGGDSGGGGDGESARPLPPLRPSVSSPSSSSSSTTTTDITDSYGGSVGESRPPVVTVTGVHPVSGSSASDRGDENSFVVVGRTCLVGGGGGGGDVGPGNKRRKPGSKWRGWGAVSFFMGASLVIGLAVDFVAWQWWRHTLLR